MQYDLISNRKIGREIQKTRPAAAFSPSRSNLKSGLALFAPVTTQIKGYSFEATINHKQKEQYYVIKFAR